MNIVVLAGGTSTERDVSFASSALISKALKSRGHKVIMLDVFFGYGDEECDVSGAFDKADEIALSTQGIGEKAPDIEAVKALRKDKSDAFFGPNVIAICKQADIVFIGLHGENGENGKVQAALDLMGIKYTGSGYLGSALAMNKVLTRQMCLRHSLPVAEGMSVRKGYFNGELPPFGFPCVVKPCSGGSSVGVFMVNNEDEYKNAVKEAFTYDEELVIEKCIKGREFSVGVIDGKACPVIEIAPISGFYDYKNKYQAGAAVETCPADIPEEAAAKMQKYAEIMHIILQLSVYSRTDFMMDENGDVFALECNTLPGMTPTSLLPQEAKVLGISYEDLCEKIIKLSLEKY
ncbi:MAG: D-alanine--D-alanine ligase [Eubacterium sp.]|nr:D-alanine--D-alanine ligase [Eubacterium sp.]